MPAFDYTIEKKEVLRYLGHREQEIGEELNEEIDRISQFCLESAEPRYFFKIFPLETVDGAPSLSPNGLRLLGNDIKKHLENAKFCAVFAATLGFGVERTLVRLGQRSTVSELIYNAACTALIEAVGDRCEAEIVGTARGMGFVTSYRYSPGYGDFPLEQQPEVLNAIDAGARLGITLTDSFLMLPRKSVSALVGMYPKELRVKRGGSSCGFCENHDTCEFRKEGFGCGG